MIRAVIGRGFGDEGKGLATDYFASQQEGALVIRHNGGAQSGHTVETGRKRFVFHELSAGSFRRADTLWAETFLPDLYKLSEEAEAFRALTGFVPKIYAQERTCMTLVDDVLLNMAAETGRGAARHGSCGMGINEADLRCRAGFGITMEQMAGWEEERTVLELERIRREYLPERMSELGLTDRGLGEYGELLRSKNVLRNAARMMKRNLRYLTLTGEPGELLKNYSNIIFESGQGLLLDACCEENFPHVTASRTGLTNPVKLLAKSGNILDEAVYVARTYLTRHGAGPLALECGPEKIGRLERDETNLTNDWQGSLRYAPYESVEAFLRPVLRDLEGAPEGLCASLMLTHLNETDGKLRTAQGDLTARELTEHPMVGGLFQKFYFSDARDSEKVVRKE